jgi:hypothetical protein
MSRTQFYGYRTPYDEEQSRERYLEYLKVAGRNSAIKQGATRDALSGVVTSKPTEKTTSEILADEAEMSRVLQQRIAQLVQRADSRQRTPVETDDDYEQRTNPIQYVLSRLPQAQAKILITSFEAIKADLGGTAGNMLPSDFLTYMDAFERAYRETGGVSKFNLSTRIIDELQGLRTDMAKPQDVNNLSTLVQQLSNELKDDIQTAREITSREMAQLDADQRSEIQILKTQGNFILRSATDAIGKLNALERITQMVDYDRIQQIVQQGTESVLQGQADISRDLQRMEVGELGAIDRVMQMQEELARNQRRAELGELGAIDRVMENQKDIQSSILRSQINAQSIFQQLLEKLETLPTQDEVSALENAFDALLTSQTLDYEKAENVIESTNELLAVITPQKLRDIEALLSTIDQKSSAILSQRRAEVETADFDELKKRVKKELFTLPSGKVKTRLTEDEERQLSEETSKRLGATFIGAEASRPMGQRSIEESLFSTTPIGKAEPKSRIIEEEEEEEREGFGMKQHAFMIRNKIQPKFSKIVGRGIAVPSNQTKYTEFGKYAISQPQLSKGILSLRYLNNGRQVQNIPSTKITEEFTDFLDEFLETQHLDKKRLEKLPANEKRMFTKLINGSGLYGKYKVRLLKSKEEEDEEKRFNLVKGIYIAGNDNPQVVKELKQFIIKFMADGRIPKKEGTDLLLQLSL